MGGSGNSKIMLFVGKVIGQLPKIPGAKPNSYI